MPRAPPALKIHLLIRHPAWGPPARWRAALSPLRVLLARRPDIALPPNAAFTLVLADDETLRALNARWRGKDRPTNVLSFPSLNPEQGELGDVLVAHQTLAREAAEQHKTFHSHALHLILHGVLHLLGYDHESAEDARHMERVEVEILLALGVANPYDEAGFDP